MELHSIALAKFSVLYSPNCEGECEDRCQCSNNQEKIKGIGALELLEMHSSEDFKILEVRSERTGRKTNVNEVKTLTNNLLQMVNGHC